MSYKAKNIKMNIIFVEIVKFVWNLNSYFYEVFIVIISLETYYSPILLYNQ